MLVCSVVVVWCDVKDHVIHTLVYSTGLWGNVILDKQVGVLPPCITCASNISLVTKTVNVVVICLLSSIPATGTCLVPLIS